MTDSSIILTAARHILASRERSQALEEWRADLARRRDSGEQVYPAKAHAEAADKAAYETEIAAGDLILTTAAETEEEALLQLAIVAVRLNWISSCVPTEQTPETAERAERALLSALAVLQRQTSAEVAAFLDEYADVGRDVLRMQPPAVAEAAS